METFKIGGGAKNMKRRTCTKWHWAREEDEILTNLVGEYGPRNWNYIAGHIPGRTGKSCRLRWVNQLNPKINRRPFTDEEQQRLLELQWKHGNKWSTIASFFPGRTDNQLKNQYHVLVGTRYMTVSSPSSSSTDLCGTSSGGSADHSRYGTLKTLDVGSEFSDVTSGGHVAPPKTDVLGGMWMRLLTEGLSTLYDGDETWITADQLVTNYLSVDSVSLSSVCANLTTRNEDHMMSDTNSTTISGFGLVALTKTKEGVGVSKFIDFMGVGN